MEKKEMKKTAKIVVVLIILIIIGYFFFQNIEKKENVDISNDTQKPIISEPVKLCFYFSKKTDRDFYDKAWLKLDILEDKIFGEFRNYPAEKDSKIGNFEGTVGPLNPEIMGRTAMVWWDSLAEGMQVKEELQIEFGDGSAVVLFGEMEDRGDGVYAYKDKTKLTPGPTLSQMDCSSLNEIIGVEKYLRENISKISNKSPVLGGTWYLVSVFVDSSSDSGAVVFEDGHIQAEAIFDYIFDEKSNLVVVKNFKIK